MIFKIAFGASDCMQKLSQADFSESIDPIGADIKYAGNPILIFGVLKLDAKVS